jgi:hypothetical protein
LFRKCPAFQKVDESFIIYFEAGIGAWDTSVYYAQNPDGSQDEELLQLGIYYMMIFLLINLVMLLNYVVAILGSVFEKYNEQSQGLYLNVLVNLFPSLEWHDEYGCLICAHAPVDLTLFFLTPIFYGLQCCLEDDQRV